MTHIGRSLLILRNGRRELSWRAGNGTVDLVLGRGTPLWSVMS